MNNKFFISDFHFGTDGQIDPIKLSDFEFFCEKNLSDGDELYILGDFFDFWIEYKNFVQAEFAEIYTILTNAKKRGVKIFIVRGNHDFFRGNFFQNLGFSVFDNEVKFEQNGKKILCIHGDAVAGNSSYLLMKSVFRSSVFQFLYKMLPFNSALCFAQYLSGLSRKKNRRSENQDSRKAKYRTLAFNFAEKENCDILIMGHSHIPNLTASANKIYANCGAWLENPTFIVLEENKIQLKEFRGKNKENIVLQEISLN